MTLKTRMIIYKIFKNNDVIVCIDSADINAEKQSDDLLKNGYDYCYKVNASTENEAIIKFKEKERLKKISMIKGVVLGLLALFLWYMPIAYEIPQSFDSTCSFWKVMWYEGIFSPSQHYYNYYTYPAESLEEITPFFVISVVLFILSALMRTKAFAIISSLAFSAIIAITALDVYYHVNGYCIYWGYYGLVLVSLLSLKYSFSMKTESQ